MLKRRAIEAHQTRLFPKNMGADNYIVNGLAARCDWVVLSDVNAPHSLLLKNVERTPRVVFLSLREPFAAINYFYDKVLPQLSQPFVLITGSEDVTIPNQTDKRWRPFNNDEKQKIAGILQHPCLIHWYTENLDDLSNAKLSPLPVGLVYPFSDTSPGLFEPAFSKLSERPNTVLCSHRIRDGEQWANRKHVSSLAAGVWSSFCVLKDDEVPEPKYFEDIHQHSFVLCVEGGGLDPSPKAWHAILNGAIPIICSPTLRQAYEQLPAVFVDRWTPDAITVELLTEWKARLTPWYDEPVLRKQVMNKLGLDYWWDKIRSTYLHHLLNQQP